VITTAVACDRDRLNRVATLNNVPIVFVLFLPAVTAAENPCKLNRQYPERPSTLSAIPVISACSRWLSILADRGNG
jgi:hypothetical protein